jgi:hypothetical protein
VTAVDLHPLTWSGVNRATTGFPVVAAGQTAAAVLTRIAELSEPYGTEIRVNGAVGRLAT